MPLSTTTLETILENYSARLKGSDAYAKLSPTLLPTHYFDEVCPDDTLETLMTGDMRWLRRFDWVRGKPLEELGLTYPTASERRQQVELVVCYPIGGPRLYGVRGLREAEKVIESDAAQLRDLIVAAENYASGQNETSATWTVEQPQQPERMFYLLRMQVTVQFYETRSI